MPLFNYLFDIMEPEWRWIARTAGSRASRRVRAAIGAARGAPRWGNAPHSAPPSLTCNFVGAKNATAKFRLVSVEGCGVEWGVVE
jgi:hypothetical protein